MTEEEKGKIINAFNNAWSRKIASENSYGKLASKEMFENKEEIKTEISTDCSYYEDVMTEEIIIDGVDVAGCINFVGCNMCNDFLDGQCEGHNCEYKQLKRLELEHNTICYNLGLLEQENKELKEKVKSRENELANMAEQANMRINTYRSALEEIKNGLKEICKEECDYTKPKFCGDCDCRYGQILTKINEVLQ